MKPGGSVKVELDEGGYHEFAIGTYEGGRSLADLLAAHGFPLNTRCGQRGLCRGCEVDLRTGMVIDRAAMEVHPRLAVRACQMRVAGAVTLSIPQRSRIEHRPQVGETFRIEIPCAHQPLFEPEPGGPDTAFAVDVGTTTVVVLLVDLPTGDVLSRAGGFNEQIRFGDNVLTRIDTAREPEALAAMQRAVVTGTIAPLLLRACQRAGRGPSRIAGGAVAGNTTMLHLLAGVDPTPLGFAPFIPRFIEGRQPKAAEIGLAVEGLAPGVPVQFLPGMAAYVGADITAGVYATGMIYDAAPSLLVDIGTNGEIVLQNGGRLTACSTAAGPAFEGCGLRSGTRAREGAISAVRLRFDPFSLEVETIGEVSPARAAGICGSAYIDFLSQGRSCELLSESGRFEPEAWAAVPAQHRAGDNGEKAVRIAGEAVISEADVAVLLQAKAAIGAGIETLLETAGLQAADLSRVYLAGGFGMHLNVGHAIAVGLLPGIGEETVRVVGNTALAGALLALLDRTTLAEMETLRQQVEIIELNLQDTFEDRYVEHLMLP